MKPFALSIGVIALVLLICIIVYRLPNGINEAPSRENEVIAAEDTLPGNEEDIALNGNEKDIALPDNEEDTALSESENEISETVDNDETEDIMQPQILNFVDVFGEEYQTEINPNVPMTELDKSGFIHDGEKLFYEDDTHYSRLGGDVSHHQGYIDWEKVKAAGYDFAFLRIGYRGYGKAGTLNLDKRFYENIEGAHKAGLDVGVYFFSQAINLEEAKEEAQFVIEHLNGYELELPVVYDPESILDDEARTDNVSGEQFTENTVLFCKLISEAGYKPMVYSNMLWEAFMFDMPELNDYPIWYADYEDKPQTPYRYTFWQYTNEGSVDGISGAADLDIEIIEK